MPYDYTSYITVGVFNTGIGDLGLCPDERYQHNTGLIQQSRAARSTEVEAILRMLYGPGIMETDTIGEAIRAGKCRCARCQQFKDKSDFTAWTKKETGVEYRKSYCKGCRAAMERTKRWSHVVPADPYPRRAG